MHVADTKESADGFHCDCMCWCIVMSAFAGDTEPDESATGFMLARPHAPVQLASL